MDLHGSGELSEVRDLIEELVKELDVPFGFVCEPVDGDPAQARTVAFWMDDQFVAEVRYDVAETPCARVREQGSLYHSSAVGVIYPRDASLRAWGVESYLGVAITDPAGLYLGHVGVMDRRPLAHPAAAETAIRNVALRLAQLFQLDGA